MAYCYCYLITDGSHYKIGIAVNPDKRIRQLQTGHPKTLTLLAKKKCACRKDAAAMESQFHKNLRQHRQVGEWFTLDERLLQVMLEALRTKSYFDA